jgi:hypothetical protein
MAPNKMSSAQNSQHKRQRPNPTAESPIQVSTPPVRIIGAERRHKGGFHLSDR